MTGGTHKKTGASNNPRHQNGSLRRKHRARLKAIGAPCAICGRAIHYDEPSDANHPLSFVIDEIHPVSRWREFGYNSPAEAAQDWNNIQAVHYICNQRKAAHTMVELKNTNKQIINLPDGEW